MQKLRYIVLSMRPRQWTKNFVIFLPLIFSINLHWDKLAITTVAFALFCLISGGIYLVNDILDIDRDRAHPQKRRRPLASGKLKARYAIVAAIVLFAAGYFLSFRFNFEFGVVMVVYLVVMIAYSLLLKHLIIIDAFTIAAGFVLRAVAGAAIIQVPISPWLYICTFLGALFIALVKRRQELVKLEEGAEKHRATLEHYTPKLLDEMVSVVTASTVIAYSLYTFTAENLPHDPPLMMLTIPFVIYGIFRYYYLIHTKEMGDRPEEVVLTDIPLIASVVLWALTSALILFFAQGR